MLDATTTTPPSFHPTRLSSTVFQLITITRHIHPKFRNINPHNVTHPLISPNPRGRMFVAQISLLVVTFLSLLSWNFVINANHWRSQSHALALRHVSICGVLPSCSCYFSFSFSYATCWMLVHACATSSGKAKWSAPNHAITMLHFVSFHSVTWYTNSILSRIHVHARKLCDITCTLVATGVILRSLESIIKKYSKFRPETAPHAVHREPSIHKVCDYCLIHFSCSPPSTD
jgi:hypothetical protein